MKALLVSFFMMASSLMFGQNKDIEILKSEEGNEITYYAKSNVREVMTVEMNVEGSGFTTSVPLPVKAELSAFEKKELVKIILDASGNSSYNVSFKQYKGSVKPQQNASTQKPTLSNEALNRGIVVFSKDGCGKCTYAKNYFKEKGKAFTELNISKNESDEQLMWDKLKEAGFSGGTVQTPVIVVDGKVHYNMDLKSFLSNIK